MLVGDVAPGIPEWATSVTVSGVERAVESVSWDTEIAGDLPDQVVATGGLSGSSGTITWATQDPVSDRPVSPWAKVAGWPPSPGDVVQVRVSDGFTNWTRWTGVIDNTTGDPTSGYQSKVIDFRDRITGTFTHQALLRHMVPLSEGGSYRSIGLNFWYPLTAALRSTGFCNVPPVEAPSAMSAPLQGSVWPEAGDIRDAGGLGGAIHASFYRTDFGYAAGGLTASYAPRLNESSSSPVQITMVVPTTHNAVAYTEVFYGGPGIRFRASADRGLIAYYTATGGSWTSVASLPISQAGNYTVATLLIKNGVWTIRTNGGGQATGSRAMASGTMSGVYVTANSGARVAGVQVSHPNSVAREFASLEFVPNMRFDPSGLASTMDMMPALRVRSVTDLVDEVLSATLTASWWDETGTLILRPSDLLRGTAPSQTVTTADDITSLSWEDSLLAVRSAVEVTWRDPAISKGRQHRMELWRGPEESVAADDDPTEQFITPDSGMEWFGVDRGVRRLDDTNWGAYNSRRGSFAGFWYSDQDGNEASTTVAAMGLSTDLLYADSLKLTTVVNGMPTYIEANTGTSPSATALRPHFRGKALPVIRGMGRGEWVDATYRATAGPDHAPVLEHDLSYWGQEYFEGGSVAQRIGDFLASMVAAPQPTIPGLGVIYDPRRQLGDVYTLRSEWLGIELRLLVVGIREEHGNGGASQSLTVRVIRAESIRPVTYDDLAAAWDTGNYTSLQAAWAALTYDDFAASPLEGAPV